MSQVFWMIVGVCGLHCEGWGNLKQFVSYFIKIFEKFQLLSGFFFAWGAALLIFFCSIRVKWFLFVCLGIKAFSNKKVENSWGAYIAQKYQKLLHRRLESSFQRFPQHFHNKRYCMELPRGWHPCVFCNKCICTKKAQTEGYLDFSSD